jgi:hypothetical protein
MVYIFRKVISKPWIKGNSIIIFRKVIRKPWIKGNSIIIFFNCMYILFGVFEKFVFLFYFMNKEYLFFLKIKRRRKKLYLNNGK